jgi:hypothetical protein
MQQPIWGIRNYTTEKDINEIFIPLLKNILNSFYEKNQKMINLVVAYLPAANAKNKYPILKKEIDGYIHIYLYIIDPAQYGYLIEDFCFGENPKYLLTYSNMTSKIELYKELAVIFKKIKLLNNFGIIDYSEEDPNTIINLLKSDQDITLDKYLEKMFEEKIEESEKSEVPKIDKDEERLEENKKKIEESEKSEVPKIDKDENTSDKKIEESEKSEVPKIDKNEEKIAHPFDKFIDTEGKEYNINYINIISNMLYKNKYFIDKGLIREYTDIVKIRDPEILLAVLNYNRIVRSIKSQK